MIFEKNKKIVAYYETPYGSILLGISASNFEMKETEDHQLKVDYALDINEEPLADCKIRIRIQSKDAGFSLRQ